METVFILLENMNNILDPVFNFWYQYPEDAEINCKFIISTIGRRVSDLNY